MLGYDAFNPGTNFRELNDPNAVVGNQNGVVFFPGSTPLYKNGVLVGGLGVSGDGVDQDDVGDFPGRRQFSTQSELADSTRRRSLRPRRAAAVPKIQPQSSRVIADSRDGFDRIRRMRLTLDADSLT